MTASSSSSSSSSTEAKLRRIEKISSLLRGICTALIVPLVLFTLAGLIVALVGTSEFTITYGSQSVPLRELTSAGRAFLAGGLLVTGAIFLKALWHVRRLTDNYARREIFTADSARQIRNFGLTYLLWGVVKIAWAFLPLLQNPAKFRVSIGFEALILGALIVVISWVAEMAATLREENELTI